MQPPQPVEGAAASGDLLDTGSGVEIAAELESVDPLKFKDMKRYKDRLVAAQKQSGEKDALVVMRGRLKGETLVVAASSSSSWVAPWGLWWGSGSCAAVDEALKHRAPMVCFAASGGARMQESLFSLMQMAKTSAALGRLRAAGLPFISVMTDPTMGGVSASFAMLGDINIAEPGALIGFAGPRVIEQTVRETLPEGFQRSEFLMEHGALDMILDRRVIRGRIADLLAILSHRPRAKPLEPLGIEGPVADTPVVTAAG